MLELRVVAVAERVPAVDAAERVVAVAERVPAVDAVERETEDDPALRADSERDAAERLVTDAEREAADSERLADAERAAAVVWLPKVRLLAPDERPLTPALRLVDDASREATRACASDVLRISRALVIPTLRRSNERSGRAAAKSLRVTPLCNSR